MGSGGGKGLSDKLMASVASANACGSRSRRRKREVVVQESDDSTSPTKSSNVSAAKKFIWSHEDEMSLLCTMLQFTIIKGYYPKMSYHMDVLYDMMTENSSFRLKSHLKKDQMTCKVRSMRKRHMKTLKMVEDGKKLTQNEQAIYAIGNLVWATKINKRTDEQQDVAMVVDKLQEDGRGKTTSSEACPSLPISISNAKVGNGISGAANICDGDKAVDESNVLEFLTQLFVWSGNRGLGYSPKYLEKKMLLLESAKRKAIGDICNEIQEEERNREFRLANAYLEIIEIFKSNEPNSL